MITRGMGIGPIVTRGLGYCGYEVVLVLGCDGLRPMIDSDSLVQPQISARAIFSEIVSTANQAQAGARSILPEVPRALEIK